MLPKPFLPLYTGHKVVNAAKIHAIEGDQRLDLGAWGRVEIDASWLAKHGAHAGGYLVVYADGYKSFSPAEPFEAGYTAVEGPRVIDAGHRYRIGGVQVLQFLKKTRDSDGYFKTVATGTTNEELIDVLLDRLRTINAQVPCRENSLAITKLEEANHWLQARTRDRVERGVEATPAV